MSPNPELRSQVIALYKRKLYYSFLHLGTTVAYTKHRTPLPRP
jgi:hypothetical protein